MFFRNIKPFNRRKFARLEPDNCIQYMCIYKDGEEEIKCQIDIVDVSQGGLLIVSGDNKIPAGTEVTIQFQLPNQKELNTIFAEVVRTYRRSHGKWYYSGVEFTDSSQQSIKTLFDFVIDKK